MFSETAIVKVIGNENENNGLEDGSFMMQKNPLAFVPTSTRICIR